MRRQITIIIMALGFLATSSPISAAQKATPKPTPRAVVHQVAEKVVTPPPPKTHTVASGDSLSIIANEEQLESWRPLWNANPALTDPDLIYEGQQLIVPDGPVADRPLPATVQPPVVTQTVVRRSPAAAANYAPGAGGILERIRMREAGGNYATNTGNGYYGAYQFNLGTWRGVGGTGLPSDTSPAEQDMRAQMLYNQRGCSPWPNTCY